MRDGEADATKNTTKHNGGDTMLRKLLLAATALAFASLPPSPTAW